MIKEHVNIEFRYHDEPKSEHDSGYRNKTITIGVFDTFEEAIIEGNKALEILEKKFKLNPNYNRVRRFSKNGGCFGQPERLITNLTYLQTPFEFYAQITKLTHDDVEKTILDILESKDRYTDYKLSKFLIE